MEKIMFGREKKNSAVKAAERAFRMEEKRQTGLDYAENLVVRRAEELELAMRAVLARVPQDQIEQELTLERAEHEAAVSNGNVCRNAAWSFALKNGMTYAVSFDADKDRKSAEFRRLNSASASDKTAVGEGRRQEAAITSLVEALAKDGMLAASPPKQQRVRRLEL